MLVERVAPLADEPLQLLPLELADALPVRREVLGEEGLDLLAVGLALGRVGGLHGPDTTQRSAEPDRSACGSESRSTTVRRATAAAPTRGPSAPRPAGTMRAPRAKLMRARRSSSAWAAAKNTSPKPSATEPATTARPRSSSTQTSATARPTRRPVRSRTASGASAGGLPGDRRDGETRRLGLEAAAAPARARATFGLDDEVADVAGVAVGAVEQPAVEHDAAADAGAARPWRGSPSSPRAAPHQPSPRASALASLSTTTGRPGQLRQPRSQREVPPAGDVQRRDEPAAGGHRAAAADADGDRSARTCRRAWRSTSAARPGQGSVRSVGRSVLATTCPSSSTTPTASLVPPMSIAR